MSGRVGPNVKESLLRLITVELHLQVSSFNFVIILVTFLHITQRLMFKDDSAKVKFTNACKILF